MTAITITISGTTTQDAKAAQGTLTPHLVQFLKQLEVNGCQPTEVKMNTGEEEVDLTPATPIEAAEEKAEKKTR